MQLLVSVLCSEGLTAADGGLGLSSGFTGELIRTSLIASCAPFGVGGGDSLTRLVGLRGSTGRFGGSGGFLCFIEAGTMSISSCLGFGGGGGLPTGCAMSFLWFFFVSIRFMLPCNSPIDRVEPIVEPMVEPIAFTCSDDELNSSDARLSFERLISFSMLSNEEDLKGKN